MREVTLWRSKITGLIKDKDWFEVFYSPETETYFIGAIQSWIIDYRRFYAISGADYELYKTDRDKFLEKHRSVIRGEECLGESFAGAECLRDYDGAPDFQHAYPPADGAENPFRHFVWHEGVLYAKIAWNIGTILVPPVKVIERDGEKHFPLRDNCELQANARGEPICYRLR